MIAQITTHRGFFSGFPGTTLVSTSHLISAHNVLTETYCFQCQQFGDVDSVLCDIQVPLPEAGFNLEMLIQLRLPQELPSACQKKASPRRDLQLHFLEAKEASIK